MGKNTDIQAAGETASRRLTAGSMEGCITPEDFAGMKDTDIREADTNATLTDRLKEYIEHVASAGL